MDKKNETLKLHNESLQKQMSNLHGKMQELKAYKQVFVLQTQEKVTQEIIYIL